MTQLARQVLAGLYLQAVCGCRVQYLLLDRHHARDRKTEIALGRLTQLVPSADLFYSLHHASWRGVYEVAAECLPAGNGLLSYMAGKRAK